MKFLTRMVSVSPDTRALVIRPVTVKVSSANPLPIEYEQVMLELVDSFSQAMELLRQELGDVAPSELRSHFGIDRTTTLPESMAEE
jgi:hypothetical protein